MYLGSWLGLVILIVILCYLWDNLPGRLLLCALIVLGLLCFL